MGIDMFLEPASSGIRGAAIFRTFTLASFFSPEGCCLIKLNTENVIIKPVICLIVVLKKKMWPLIWQALLQMD